MTTTFGGHVRELHLTHDPDQRTVTVVAVLQARGGTARRHTATGHYDTGDQAPALTLDVNVDPIEGPPDGGYRTFVGGPVTVRVALTAVALNATTESGDVPDVRDGSGSEAPGNGPERPVGGLSGVIGSPTAQPATGDPSWPIPATAADAYRAGRRAHLPHCDEPGLTPDGDCCIHAGLTAAYRATLATIEAATTPGPEDPAITDQRTALNRIRAIERRHTAKAIAAVLAGKAGAWRGAEDQHRANGHHEQAADAARRSSAYTRAAEIARQHATRTEQQ